MKPSILIAVSLLFSCMEKDAEQIVPMDSGIQKADSAVTCECPDPVLPEVIAADVSYDNADSDLASNSVQGAIGELAMRKVPDFAERISSSSNVQIRTLGSEASVLSDCGGSEGDFIAIGGGCTSQSPNLRLIESDLRESGMRCRWEKALDQTVTVTARVVCLSVLPSGN